MTLNDSEWKVMRALWERGASGVAELHAALAQETDWAYSTVKTLLERLVDKGAVAIEPGRAGRLFVPQLAASEARRSALRQLLDRAFDGTFAALVQHLSSDGELSRREREELRELLAAEAGQSPAIAAAAESTQSGPPAGAPAQRRGKRPTSPAAAGGEND